MNVVQFGLQNLQRRAPVQSPWRLRAIQTCESLAVARELGAIPPGSGIWVRKRQHFPAGSAWLPLLQPYLRARFDPTRPIDDIPNAGPSPTIQRPRPPLAGPGERLDQAFQQDRQIDRY